jgi:hypothetical protein
MTSSLRDDDPPRRDIIAELGAENRLCLVSLKFWPTVFVFERDAQPVLFTPNDAALPVQLVGLHD